MGKHITQHHNLDNLLQDAERHADAVYRKFHNGDSEINDMVMSNRDAIRDARSYLRGHIEHTADDDKKVAWYNRWNKFGWLILPGFLYFLAREVYNIIM